MTRYIFFTSLLVAIISLFSFFNPPVLSQAQQVKQLYLKQTQVYIKQTRALQLAVASGNGKKMQQQFLLTRAAYKQMEPLVEYYFDFYATKLNGPPIPFFEEDEADMPEQQPVGMQVIEELIFPGYEASNKAALKSEVDELVRYAIELPTINESFAFNDENIFDAFVEAFYRLTALGITGFDSQTAVNSLPECKQALNGLQQYLSIYKDNFNKKMPGQFTVLNKLLINAQIYLDKRVDFNGFDRMYFIINYLDPATKITGKYKQVYELNDQNTGIYYSAIRKNNSLFNAGAFNVNRFLDDFSTSPDKIELGRKLFLIHNFLPIIKEAVLPVTNPVRLSPMD